MLDRFTRPFPWDEKGRGRAAALSRGREAAAANSAAAHHHRPHVAAPSVSLPTAQAKPRRGNYCKHLQLPPAQQLEVYSDTDHTQCYDVSNDCLLSCILRRDVARLFVSRGFNSGPDGVLLRADDRLAPFSWLHLQDRLLLGGMETDADGAADSKDGGSPPRSPKPAASSSKGTKRKTAPEGTPTKPQQDGGHRLSKRERRAIKADHNRNLAQTDLAKAAPAVRSPAPEPSAAASSGPPEAARETKSPASLELVPQQPLQSAPLPAPLPAQSDPVTCRACEVSLHPADVGAHDKTADHRLKWGIYLRKSGKRTAPRRQRHVGLETCSSRAQGRGRG